MAWTIESTDARMAVNAAQLRAARALLGWSREELAKHAGVSPMTVRAFELLGSDPKQSTLQKIRRALSQAGVEFIDETETQGAGVRFKKPNLAGTSAA